MPYFSHFANMLLYSPFDNKAEIDPKIRRLLTKDEFFKYCYSEPQFENKILDDSFDELIPVDNYYQKKSELMDQWFNQKAHKENFINWLYNEIPDSVYTISGNAGTGKTTYVNYLKRRYSDLRWIVLNMSQASSSVKWLGDYMTNFTKFELAYKKIISSILEYMKNMLFDVKAENDIEYCAKIMANLDKICRNYKDKFGLSIRSKNSFYEKLCKLVGVKNKQETIIENVVKYLVEYFDKLLSINSFSQEMPLIINIFLIFIRCIKSDDKVTIIVFDNLERFVCYDELYNDEINNIRIMISNYALSIKSEDTRNNNIFKFIMVIRNKTERMTAVRLQSADNLPKNLDISEWYDVDDIINKKVNWLENKGVRIDDIHFLKSITCDCRVCKSGEITGLQRFIEPLFNNNKRLMIEFLGMLINKPSYKETIEMYFNLMTEDNKICRFAARSIIRGMILNCLETEDSLFKHLKTYRDNRVRGIGITRKILTVLHNLALDGNVDVSIRDVVANILNRANVEEYFNRDNDKLNSFSEVLYYMNSYNRRTNNWIQLVDLQIKDEQDKIVINNSDNLKDLICNKNEKIYLNIMPAGEAYLRYLVTSFEFFSLRYSAPYEPLYMLIPDENELNNNKTSDIRCYKKIREVSRKAFDCINSINDNLRLKWESGTNGVLHKDRIKQAFYDYIDKFMYMLRYRFENGIKWEKKNYEELVKEITVIRDSFKA